MKTVIYLDELLLTNFLAAAALLLGAGLLCARQCSGLRLMAGSAAAAAASLGILLPELPGPAAFLYKVFTCCAAVAAAYGVPGLRNFVQLCMWYLLLNLLLCGAVLLPGVQSANLCVYLPLSPGRLLLCCGAVLAVLRGVLFCFGRAGTRCFAAVLELEGAVLSVQAFCDTGFSVQDPLTPPLPGTVCCLPFRPRPCAPAKAVQRVFWPHSAARKHSSHGQLCWAANWPYSWASAEKRLMRSISIDVQEGYSCFMFCTGSGVGSLHGWAIAAAHIFWRARPACPRP